MNCIMGKHVSLYEKKSADQLAHPCIHNSRFYLASLAEPVVLGLTWLKPPNFQMKPRRDPLQEMLGVIGVCCVIKNCTLNEQVQRMCLIIR